MTGIKEQYDKYQEWQIRPAGMADEKEKKIAL